MTKRQLNSSVNLSFLLPFFQDRQGVQEEHVQQRGHSGFGSVRSEAPDTRRIHRGHNTR